tara:strand:+ start:1282 stop:1773 length:492 start_codon:yes stop_codon:yes gene_type:complete
MLIHLKNKDTLIVNHFNFKCCVGKNGLKKEKREGDLTTPKGIFQIKELYYRADKIKKVDTNLKKVKIKKYMGWCNDPKHKKYNSLINIRSKIKHEKMFRKDKKYDFVIIIDYNLKKPIPFKGSAIFIHLTTNFKPTAGCIALKKNDMLILLKLINKKTKINIT